MTVKNYRFKRASEIEVPQEFFNPITCGYKDLDETLSEMGGAVPSQVILLTGKPGSGKTSLALKFGSAIATKEPVAFISKEMSEFQLAFQARKLPGFGNIHTTEEFDQRETLKYLDELKPRIIILDSLQKCANYMKNPDSQSSVPF